MIALLRKFVISLFSLVPLLCFGHGSASLHYEDFISVFNGYGDDAFKELSYTLSSGIDHDLPEAFRQKLGTVPGNHRILGHGWTLDDSIPRETLEYLSKSHPGKEKEIIAVWRTFAKRINSDAARLTGLPPKQAKALVSLLYDIHLLGDIEPDNKLIEYVLSEKRIVKNIEKDAEVLFKGNKQYIALIRKRLARALRHGGAGRQAVAEALMTELYSLRMGDMLHKTWGQTLKTGYSADRAVVANARRAERLARPIAKIPGITRIPRKAADFVGRPGVKFSRGLLQEHRIKGKLVRTLSVPVAQKTAGLSAGVMTFVFTEGVTVYKFSRGSISEEEFIRESAKNCGGALVVGTATYVLVALGATPTGWAVIGVGIAAELIYEVTFDYVCDRLTGPVITMDDILGRLPTSIQRRTSPLEFTKYPRAPLEPYHQKVSPLENPVHPGSPLEPCHQKVSPLEVVTERRSFLEIGEQ